MVEVPRASERLAAFAATFTAEDHAATARMILMSYKRACDVLRHSRTFHAILTTTLTLGNFMNQGSTMAGTRGFRLGYLRKLGDTRTRDGKSSLLGYIAKCVARQVVEGEGVEGLEGGLLGDELGAVRSQDLLVALGEVGDMVE